MPRNNTSWLIPTLPGICLVRLYPSSTVLALGERESADLLEGSLAAVHAIVMKVLFESG
jgi:hypothetical protein